MAQTVYVLMSLEGSGKTRAWRPVAVVSNPDLATQWMEHGKDVDWVPLELDDVTNLSPGDKPQTFQPRETVPGDERAAKLSERMETTIQNMQKIIDDQAAVIDKMMKKRKGAKAAIDPIPPRPTEGGKPFSPTLDAQGLADYVESHATYPVDNEFVYEMFRGASAVLKLVPIASLREGGRDHNQQSKRNEDKYLKQDLKTQPPAVVENGEVLDGNHRLRANMRRGLTHMWCYVVTNEEAPNGDTDTDSSSQS